MESRSLRILLVEDDEVDAEYFLRSLRIQGSTLELTVAQTAIEALHLLCGWEGQLPLAGPYVILLPVHLPGMNGIEFLHELRSDPRLKASIVFVLGEFISDHDLQQVNAYSIAGYLSRRVLVDECALLIHFFEIYRDTVELPILA